MFLRYLLLTDWNSAHVSEVTLCLVFNCQESQVVTLFIRFMKLLGGVFAVHFYHLYRSSTLDQRDVA